MAARTSIQISRRPKTEKSTPQQERFQYLLAQLEKVKRERAALEKALQEFRRKEAEVSGPLRASLRAALRETVFSIDRLLAEGRWTRTDRRELEGVLVETARMLLERDPSDEAIKDAFDRHSATSFDDDKREELERLKAEAEELMGADLQDDVHSEEDLTQRMYEHLRQQQRRDEEEAAEKKSGSSKKLGAGGAEAAKKSLREIYRKLASALHPDREPDPKRRAEKTELMQTINRAYAKDDLFTLLEAQQRLLQIDADQSARLSKERLLHYNKLLAEQLTAARKAISDLELGLRIDYGLDEMADVTGPALMQIIRRIGKGLRQEVARQKEFQATLTSAAATKRWLKARRRLERDWFEDTDE